MQAIYLHSFRKAREKGKKSRKMRGKKRKIDNWRNEGMREGKMGQIGVLSTTLGESWENVGDFPKNVGVFSKNVGDFRRIMPWYQGEIKTDERRECEGCESKKCKIAVGCAHVRARREFSTVRRVDDGTFYATLSRIWENGGKQQD